MTNEPNFNVLREMIMQSYFYSLLKKHILDQAQNIFKSEFLNSLIFAIFYQKAYESFVKLFDLVKHRRFDEIFESGKFLREMNLRHIIMHKLVFTKKIRQFLFQNHGIFMQNCYAI